MKNKPFFFFFCLEASDIRVCAVTEPTNRDGSAQVEEGLPPNVRHCVEGLVGRRERRQGLLPDRIMGGTQTAACP